MNFYDFMSENPMQTFFLGIFLLIALHVVVNDLLFRGWNRFMRMLSIRKSGWPPSHCDADGDFKPKPKRSKERVDSSGKPMPAPTEYRP